MSFEMRPTLELMQIANAGGGFRLSANMRPTLELMQIATSAKNGGGTVTFSGLTMRPTLELMQIATAGKGHVIFEG